MLCPPSAERGKEFHILCECCSQPQTWMSPAWQSGATTGHCCQSATKMRARAGRGKKIAYFPSFPYSALDCPSQPNFLAEATEKCHWLSASLLSTWVKMSGKPWKTDGVERVKRKEAILRAALPLPSSFGACKQLEKVKLQTYVVFGCTVMKRLGWTVTGQVGCPMSQLARIWTG